MKEFAEKLIERLEEYAGKINIKCGNRGCFDFMEVDAAKGIAKDLAEEHNNGWIPCSERLPMVTDYYLIQHTRKICADEMAVAFYSVEEANVDNDYTWEFETFSDVKEIIAWQPLPAPYKPKNEEQEETTND